MTKKTFVQLYVEQNYKDDLPPEEKTRLIGLYSSALILMAAHIDALVTDERDFGDTTYNNIKKINTILGYGELIDRFNAQADKLIGELMVKYPDGAPEEYTPEEDQALSNLAAERTRIHGLDLAVIAFDFIRNGLDGEMTMDDCIIKYTKGQIIAQMIQDFGR